MHRIQEVISEAIPHVEFEPMINIAHNYASWESHLVRIVSYTEREQQVPEKVKLVSYLVHKERVHISWKVLAILSVS